MNTYCQMLKVAFWMWPAQRVLTLLGIAIAAVAVIFRPTLGLSGGGLPLLFMGISILLFPAVLAGGALWRMLSAPRIVTLAPHGRRRLLAGAMGVMVTGILLWLAAYLFFWLQAPPQYQPHGRDYYALFMLSLAFATVWSLGSFFASYSPWSMLLTLLALNAPGFVLRHYGIENMGRLWSSPWGVLVLAVTWVLFGAWYLHTRRIGAPRWMVSGNTSQLRLAISRRRPPRNRNEALDRMLLAGNSPLQVAMGWAAALLLLLAVQLLISRFQGSENPGVTVRVGFANMVLGSCALMFAGSLVMMRLRATWLVADEDRAGLFRRAEWLLLRIALLLLAFFVVMGLALWTVYGGLPSGISTYLLTVLLLWSLWACHVSLNMLRTGWYWPQLLLLAAFMASLFWMLVMPLFGQVDPPWERVALLALAAIFTREMARRRWQRADWPRLKATSLAS